MAKLCRYDHVVTAIEGLRQYAGASPEFHNAMLIVERVHDAIHDLEELEMNIPSKATPLGRPPAPFSTALHDLQVSFDKLDEFIKHMIPVVQDKSITRLDKVDYVRDVLDRIDANLTRYHKFQQRIVAIMEGGA